MPRSGGAVQPSSLLGFFSIQVNVGGSDKIPRLPVFALDGHHCAPRAVLLKWQSAPSVRVAVLVMEERGSWVVAHYLAVRWRWPLHPPITAAAAGTNARIAAGWAWAPIVHRNIYQIAVKYGSVGWGPHRFSVEFHLLFGVPELQGTEPLVRRWLLPIRQGDGGGKVNLVLHIGVGGLKAAEPVPLDKGRGSKPVSRPRRVHDLQGKEQRLKDILGTIMIINVMVSRKFTLRLCSHLSENFPPTQQNRKKQSQKKI